MSQKDIFYSNEHDTLKRTNVTQGVLVLLYVHLYCAVQVIFFTAKGSVTPFIAHVLLFQEGSNKISQEMVL